MTIQPRELKSFQNNPTQRLQHGLTYGLKCSFVMLQVSKGAKLKESGSLWCLFADGTNVFFGQMKSTKYIETTYSFKIL